MSFVEAFHGKYDTHYSVWLTQEAAKDGMAG